MSLTLGVEKKLIDNGIKFLGVCKWYLLLTKSNRLLCTHVDVFHNIKEIIT